MTDPSPTIVIEDGVAVLHWPGPNPSTFAVHREVFEDYAGVVNELAALKARRCDGCAWYGSGAGVPFGRCALAEQYDEAMSAGSAVLHVKPDHACNAWSAKEPT